MRRPHEWPVRLRAVVAGVLVVAYLAGAGGALVHGHAQTRLPVAVTDVEVAATNTTEGRTFVKALEITVVNHGDDPVDLGAFVHSERQHDYAFWAATTADGRFVVRPGKTRTVYLAAPHPTEWLTPGHVIGISLLTPSGNQRTTVAPYLPADINNSSINL